MAWTTEDIGDQSGRTAIVTGATSGIGVPTAAALAVHGARVTLAVRDTARGERTAAAMPGDVAVAELDLADLASVRRFAEGVEGPVDVLIHNAGVMALPHRRSADGFELQLATNHLGPFALTGLLLDRLADARVVTVSSSAHRSGRIAFDDLQGEQQYRRWGAYGQSKLANLLFAFELQRRAGAAALALESLAAHPGYAATELQTRGAKMEGKRLGELLMRAGNAILAQSAEAGALPTLRAATDRTLPGATFVGPARLGGMRGEPVVVTAKATAYDEDVARRLWEVSEELTGVRYALPASA